MTPDQWIAIVVVAIPSLGALALGWINRAKLNSIHIEINSRVTELLKASARAEHSEGMAIGTASADQIRAMIDQAITKAVLLAPPDALSALAATTAAATAAALITTEARAVAGDLRSTASEVAVRLARDTPQLDQPRGGHNAEQ